jgi:hypothetical protein
MMWDCEDLDPLNKPTLTVPHILAVDTEYRRRSEFNAWGVYLPHWYWQEMGEPDLTPLARAGLALCSSNYTGVGGWLPYGGMTPVQWQYTANGSLNGVTPVDWNRYQGSIQQLHALWTGDDMSISDVRMGISQMWDEAANRSTPTGRGFADDLYKTQHWAEINARFDAIDAQLAKILTMLPPVATQHTHAVTGETGPVQP